MMNHPLNSSMWIRVGSKIGVTLELFEKYLKLKIQQMEKVDK